MNNNNVKILTRFLIFLSLLLFICFYGISHPKAYVIQDFKWLNRFSSDFPFTTNYEPYTYNAQYFWFNPSSGLPNYFIVDGCSTGGLTFDIRNVSQGNISYIGSISFPEQTCTVSGFSGNKKKYYFKLSEWDITNSQGAISYGVRVENTSNWTVYVNFEDYTFSDTSDFDTLTQQQESTNSIISSSSTNTQDIINSQESSASSIIDNQNQNTQQQIESQKVCKKTTITKDDILIPNKYLDTSGNEMQSSAGNGITKYFEIGDYIKNIVSASNNSNLCFYTANQTVISCIENGHVAQGTNLTIPTNAKYVRFTINSTTNIPQFEMEACKNGNQALNDDLNDLNDSINSTDYDVSGLDNAVGWLPAGPVDSILNLPLNLFSAYSTALGLTCTSLNIPLPYVNKFLPIPCIRSLFDEIGISTWWEGFGYLAAAIILYNYLLSLYTWVDKTLTLRENTMPGYYDDNFGGGA